MRHLEPCPFCGGDVQVKHQPTMDWYWVECGGCNAQCGNYDTQDELARIWNRRDGKADLAQSMQSLTAPKPCPLCAGEPHISPPGAPHFVGCRRCQIGAFGASKGEVLDRWNRRADRGGAEDNT